MVHEGLEIHGVFPELVAQRIVNIIEIDIGARLEIIVHAHVFLAEGVLIIKPKVSAPLSRHVRHRVGTACGDADEIIKDNIMVHAEIKKARAVDPARTAAHIDHACPFFLCLDIHT